MVTLYERLNEELRYSKAAERWDNKGNLSELNNVKAFSMIMYCTKHI